jgi:hypothetical protein
MTIQQAKTPKHTIVYDDAAHEVVVDAAGLPVAIKPKAAGVGTAGQKEQATRPLI